MGLTNLRKFIHKISPLRVSFLKLNNLMLECAPLLAKVLELGPVIFELMRA